MPPVCQHCLSTEVRAVLGLASFPQLLTKQWPRWLKPLRAGGNSLLLGVWWHVVLFTHPGLQHINSAHAFSELFLEEMGEPWALNRQPWAGRGPGLATLSRARQAPQHQVGWVLHLHVGLGGPILQECREDGDHWGTGLNKSLTGQGRKQMQGAQSCDPSPPGRRRGRGGPRSAGEAPAQPCAHIHSHPSQPAHAHPHP